jgi:ABC-type sulfate/molybdate transport systems ATPase subunit
MNKRTLSIRDIGFRWNGATEFLFSGIDCDFVPGSVSALMGGNGTGKTTFLEVICQRLIAERGKVEIGARPSEHGDFNYLPQDSNRLLFAHLTLMDNIALQRVASNGKIPPSMSLLFNDASVLSRYPTQCSGGQRQRAAVCRAILDMPNFPVTLLDESFSSLSGDAKASLGPELKRTAKAFGAVVIFVSHDVFDAMRFGDRVLTLTSGRLSTFDTSDVVTEEDCWQQTSRREEILHSLRSGNIDQS